MVTTLELYCRTACNKQESLEILGIFIRKLSASDDFGRAVNRNQGWITGRSVSVYNR